VSLPDAGALLRTAERAARAGAGALAPHFAARAALSIEEKARHDFVSEADRAAERAIAAAIRAEFPSAAILAEEEERAALDQPGPLWIVDPLDGTTNFLHGFPVFAVSVACAVGGALQAGVVFDPSRGELFAAARGRGATLDGRPIAVSTQPGLRRALVGTGFPFRRLDRLDLYLAAFREIVVETAGVRRAGSAAIDLAYVACGRLDGFWEEGLGPWDLAAGALLIEEAGGVVTDFRGGGQVLARGDIVAGPAALQAELLAIVQRTMP
jgi:myo-inositol-1(or 4)-monophosphatase